MDRLKYNLIGQAIIIIAFLFLTGCDKEPELLKPDSENIHVWFKQAELSLGYRIDMVNSEEGFAISRGKGGIDDGGEMGEALIFDNVTWQAFDSFEYSDFPIIKKYNDNEVWYLIHETYKGFYKPHLYSYSNKQIKEINLPKVMWDETDYTMWTGLSITQSGKACIVGQKGNIIFYDGIKWERMYSPVLNETSESITSGDLHDVQLLSDSSGWAVGKNGVILRLNNGKWEIYKSPTGEDLNSIHLINENYGWAVGEKGTILNYEKGEWKLIDSEFRVGLKSVFAIDAGTAWIVGSRTTFLELRDGQWYTNTSINTFDDTFEDIEVIEEENGDYSIWIIGAKGIYTNSQNLKFSFTEITSQASLKKEGIAGFFFDQNDDNFPELLVLSEEGPNNFYENNGNNIFTEINRELNLTKEKIMNQCIAVGDVNNDGYNDFLELTDDIHYSISFGSSGFDFFEHPDENYLDFEYIQSDFSVVTAKFIDFDNDGNLDLYVSNYNSEDFLLANDGTGRFINVIENSGINKIINHRSYGATFSDFDNNGFIDIAISYRAAKNGQHISLFLNNGSFNFTEKIDSTFFTGISPSTFSMISEDFNNDSNADLFVFNSTLKLKALINNGKAEFKDLADETGFDKTLFHPDPINGILNAADVNNDGWIDIFIGSKLFINSPAFFFTEVTEQAGINFIGNPSFADIDNDGDMDLFIGSSVESLGQGPRAALFRNNLISNNFIKFKLNGSHSNRGGVGTKIILSAFDENNRVYSSLKQAGIGSSPMVQQDFSTIHFGMDPNYNYKAKVIFPGGIEKTIEEIEPSKIITVYESAFVNNHLTLLLKSFKRTWLLMNFNTELIRISIFLLVVFVLGFVVYKMKIKTLLYKWYSITLIMFLFLLIIHLTITSNSYQSIILSLLLPLLMGTGIVYYSNRYLLKKESKFISHYKLADILGVGGTGKVFKAIDTITKKDVAIKVLNDTLLKDEENRKRLNSEGRLLASIDHPNIVKVFEFGETEKHSFIAMEYLDGGTLHDYIENNYPFSNEKVLEITEQICLGLKEIHSNNIIHRDLKSQNIMFDGLGIIRIMDFGLSKSPLVSTMTSLGTVVGTLGYVAPEQVTNVYIDHRCDIFSLGVVIYQMLTKQLPFTGENEIALIHSIFNTEPTKPGIVNKDCNEEVEALALKCIEKEPGQRFYNVDEIISELKKIKIT